jgi:hypothetical protein
MAKSHYFFLTRFATIHNLKKTTLDLPPDKGILAIGIKSDGGDWFVFEILLCLPLVCTLVFLPYFLPWLLIYIIPLPASIILIVVSQPYLLWQYSTQLAILTEDGVWLRNVDDARKNHLLNEKESNRWQDLKFLWWDSKCSAWEPFQHGPAWGNLVESAFYHQRSPERILAEYAQGKGISPEIALQTAAFNTSPEKSVQIENKRQKIWIWGICIFVILECFDLALVLAGGFIPIFILFSWVIFVFMDDQLGRIRGISNPHSSQVIVGDSEIEIRAANDAFSRHIPYQDDWLLVPRAGVATQAIEFEKSDVLLIKSKTTGHTLAKLSNFESFDFALLYFQMINKYRAWRVKQTDVAPTGVLKSWSPQEARAQFLLADPFHAQLLTTIEARRGAYVSRMSAARATFRDEDLHSQLFAPTSPKSRSLPGSEIPPVTPASPLKYPPTQYMPHISPEEHILHAYRPVGTEFIFKNSLLAPTGIIAGIFCVLLLVPGLFDFALIVAIFFGAFFVAQLLLTYDSLNIQSTLEILCTSTQICVASESGIIIIPYSDISSVYRIEYDASLNSFKEVVFHLKTTGSGDGVLKHDEYTGNNTLTLHLMPAREKLFEILGIHNIPLRDLGSQPPSSSVQN